MDKNPNIDELVDFLSECEDYLHSWACTRTGSYKPVDTRGVRKILMYELSNGSKNPIRDFKKGVEDGTILLPTFCFAVAEKHRKELYRIHKQTVEKFEKKYHIKNEKDQD